MADRFWDLLVESMSALFMPLVCSYFAISSSLFFNVTDKDAQGLEWVANTVLTPMHYLLDGREAIQNSDGSWKLVQRFEYHNHFWIKTTASIIALPPSFLIGSALKALSFFNPETKKRFELLKAARSSTKVHSNLDLYRKMGLKVDEPAEFQYPQGFQRKAGDENVLAVEKKALIDIIALFNQEKLSWWIDCGSCLGAYRYGGVIPWDGDIDIALLHNDFENVRSLLNKLDPKKYVVQDWSTRDHPDTFLKVYIRETSTMIDIYFFSVHPETQDIRYIFSFESNMFVPEWFKVREQYFKIPAPYATVFPLKKTLFDGIEVYVPQDSKKYLQRCFGENLDPVKIYNPETGFYEKDQNHPYWKRVVGID